MCVSYWSGPPKPKKSDSALMQAATQINPGGRPILPDGRRRDGADRFWPNVDVTPGHGPKGECWIWTSGTHMGYGQLGAGALAPGKRRPIRAHVASWLMHNGPILDGLWVLHKCDVKLCVRPDHLYLGTALDNVHDAQRRGLMAVAAPKLTETYWYAFISEAQGQMLKEAREKLDLSIFNIAEMVGMGFTHVSHFEAGRRSVRMEILHCLLLFYGIDKEAFGWFDCQFRHQNRPFKYTPEEIERMKGWQPRGRGVRKSPLKRSCREVFIRMKNHLADYANCSTELYRADLIVEALIKKELSLSGISKATQVTAYELKAIMSGESVHFVSLKRVVEYAGLSMNDVVSIEQVNQAKAA